MGFCLIGGSISGNDHEWSRFPSPKYIDRPYLLTRYGNIKGCGDAKYNKLVRMTKWNLIYDLRFIT
jgi:hypothetical protein